VGNQLAIVLVCFAGGCIAFWLSSFEYRIAIIAGLAVVSIIELRVPPERKNFLVQIGKQIIELFLVKVVLPPAALLLWLFDSLPLPKIITPMPGARSRAELKKCWSDSWLTAPARYFRSNNNDKE